VDSRAFKREIMPRSLDMLGSIGKRQMEVCKALRSANMRYQNTRSKKIISLRDWLHQKRKKIRNYRYQKI
jgi:thermostable 8-oxoguanine DNA glycosylase